MKFGKILGILAGATLMIASTAAHSITLTGEAVNASISDNNGTQIVGINGLGPDVNIASLDLGTKGTPTGSYDVQIGVVNNGVGGGGFTAEQTFQNLSGNERIFSLSTLNQASEFAGAGIEVSVDGGSFVSLALTGATFLVGLGDSFIIRAFATDVLATANFDYTVAAVPLPAGLVLLLTALGGALMVSRRGRASA